LTTDVLEVPDELARRHRRRAGLMAAGTALVILFVLGLLLGSRMFSVSTTIQALWADNGDAHTIVTEQRLPRTVLALVVGAALAAAGALMQGQTRNPLADPGLLGVSAGSSFAIVLMAVLLPGSSRLVLLGAAFGGAVVVTVAVYLIGTAGGRGSSPLTLVLAGVALGALLSGITATLEILRAGALQAARGWAAGDVADRGWTTVWITLACTVVGLALAAAASRGLNAESLGADLATSLGSNRATTRRLVVIAVTLLCGAATAAVGVVWFVGLMVPHVARWITGADQRWILAYSCLLGAALMLSADVLGRIVLMPSEIPAGLVTAFIGGPVLIHLVRRRTASGL